MDHHLLPLRLQQQWRDHRYRHHPPPQHHHHHHNHRYQYRSMFKHIIMKIDDGSEIMQCGRVYDHQSFHSM